MPYFKRVQNIVTLEKGTISRRRKITSDLQNCHNYCKAIVRSKNLLTIYLNHGRTHRAENKLKIRGRSLRPPDVNSINIYCYQYFKMVFVKSGSNFPGPIVIGPLPGVW